MKVTLNQRHHGTLPPPRRGTTPDTSKLAEINPLADSKHATLHAEVLAAADRQPTSIFAGVAPGTFSR